MCTWRAWGWHSHIHTNMHAFKIDTHTHSHKHTSTQHMQRTRVNILWRLLNSFFVLFLFSELLMLDMNYICTQCTHRMHLKFFVWMIPNVKAIKCWNSPKKCHSRSENEMNDFDDFSTINKIIPNRRQLRTFYSIAIRTIDQYNKEHCHWTFCIE